MTALLRSLLTLVLRVGLVAGVVAAVLYPVSRQTHLAVVRVAERVEPAPAPPPPPAPAATPASAPAPVFAVQHQSVGVIDGELRVGRRVAADARLNLAPDPRLVPGGPAVDPPLRAGLNFRRAAPLQSPPAAAWFVRTPASAAAAGVASTGAAGPPDGPTGWTVRLPLAGIAGAGLGVAGLGYGGRRLVRLLTTERRPSAVCLHCNRRFDDADQAACPACDAPRPKVTVSRAPGPFGVQP